MTITAAATSRHVQMRKPSTKRGFRERESSRTSCPRSEFGLSGLDWAGSSLGRPDLAWSGSPWPGSALLVRGLYALAAVRGLAAARLGCGTGLAGGRKKKRKRKKEEERREKREREREAGEGEREKREEKKKSSGFFGLKSRIYSVSGFSYKHVKFSIYPFKT